MTNSDSPARRGFLLRSPAYFAELYETLCAHIVEELNQTYPKFEDEGIGECID